MRPKSQLFRASAERASGSTARKKWTLPGIVAGTRVRTSFGDLPVEALRRRDPVMTRDHGYLDVQSVDVVQLDAGFVEYHPEAYPVLIEVNALGRGQPQSRVIVSPGQRISADRHPVADAGLSAYELLGVPGVFTKPDAPVTYVVFHCGRPAEVLVEGLWIWTAP